MLNVIPNANVLDVEHREVLTGHDLLVHKDQIIDILPAREWDHSCRLLPGGEGRWIVPGLVDAHAHLLEIHDGDAAGILPTEPIEQALQRGMRNIQTAVSSGVTTIRDMGAYEARNNLLRDYVASLPVPLARILSCGHHLTVADGHFWDRGIVWQPDAGSLSDLVERVINDGADFIKVMNDARIFSDAQMQEIVRVAHGLGKPVACHAFTPDQILQSIQCAVDTIEHAYPATDEIKRLLSETRIPICPTFVAAVDSIGAHKDAVLQTFPDCTSAELTGWHANLTRHLPEAFASGLTVITGSDAGILPTPFNSLHRELHLFNAHGASTWTALQSATITAARSLGLGNVTGRLAPGLSADLFVTTANPLTDLTAALNAIEYVTYRGNLVSGLYG